MKWYFKNQLIEPYETFYHTQSERFFRGTIGGGRVDASQSLTIWQYWR